MGGTLSIVGDPVGATGSVLEKVGDVPDMVMDGISMFGGQTVKKGACSCGDVVDKVCCHDRSDLATKFFADGIGLTSKVNMIICDHGMTCNTDGFCEGCTDATKCGATAAVRTT